MAWGVPLSSASRCGHCGITRRGEDLWRCDGCERRICATKHGWGRDESCIAKHWHALAVAGTCPEPEAAGE